MGKLHWRKHVIRRTPALAMRAQDHLEQTRVIGNIVARNPKLPRIGAAILPDRSRLEPDQLGASRREAFVTPPGQLVGPAVGSRIAAFHRVDGQRVTDAESS